MLSTHSSKYVNRRLGLYQSRKIGSAWIYLESGKGLDKRDETFLKQLQKFQKGFIPFIQPFTAFMVHTCTYTYIYVRTYTLGPGPGPGPKV